jgi:hypothetical protein
MKNLIKNSALLTVSTLMLCFQSCVESEDLVTPNVASPVLILLEGTTFAATSPVMVSSTTFELDKTNILDRTKGIDSIPVPNLALEVFIHNTQRLASLTTDATGTANLEISWADLGLSEPESGSQVQLEFAGTHKSIPFRKYHTVRVQ